MSFYESALALLDHTHHEPKATDHIFLVLAEFLDGVREEQTISTKTLGQYGKR